MMPVEPFPLNMESSHRMGISLLITLFNMLLVSLSEYRYPAISLGTAAVAIAAPAVLSMKFRLFIVLNSFIAIPA